MANEKRLIDADVMAATIRSAANQIVGGSEWLNGYAKGLEAVARVLEDDAPTVDAVKVVRCKDCIKGHSELAPNGGVWCAKWNHVFHDNGFCSYGERRNVSNANH